MRRVLIALGIVALALVSVNTFAQNFHPTWSSSLREGDLYIRTPLPSLLPTAMPIANSHENTEQPAAAAAAGATMTRTDVGPISLSSDLAMPQGSAIVSPSGGVIYTPQQVASREIAKVIRRLD